MITDYVGSRTSLDPICPLCDKPVEIQHTPQRDPVTKTIGHDYCLRIETMERRSARLREEASLLNQTELQMAHRKLFF
jgi:hypothetical protein